jgi:DNA repair and recombination protein RAD52
MTRTYENIVQELDSKIPRDVISTREGGGGRKLSYLEGHYVIDRLNKVIGIGNWAYTSDVIKVFEGEQNGKFSTSYIGKVRLVCTLPGGVQTEFTDVGYGDGTDPRSPGKAHELAVKEAVTDALKRCAKNLGMSMGLALYSKEQENVDDESTQAVAQPPVAYEKKENGNAGAKEKTARSTINTSISSHSKVILERKLATDEQLKALLSNYGVSRKEELTDEQALTVLNTLKGMLK